VSEPGPRGDITGTALAESTLAAQMARAPLRWLFIALAAFIAVLWLTLLGSRPLFNPDEGRYAEIPREMLSGGDWVIPHLNGVAYVEKPPLQYWATAVSLRVFGQSEFAARLYTALCALATLAAVGFTGRVLWGFAAAWQATAVLAGSLLFIVLGQLLTLDMSLTLYTTISLCAFLLAQSAAGPGSGAPGSGGPGSSGRGSGAGVEPHVAARRWMWVAWAAAALGVLTKGLVAAAIPAAVLCVYSVMARDFSPWRRLELARGLPLFLVIAVPWHALAATRLPDFLDFFFVHEHLARYLTPSAGREEAWWFFLAVFVLGSVPWTLSALRVAALGWRPSVLRGEFDHRRFLWAWMIFVIAFFSISDSKLIPYILPAMPALALLIGASPLAALRREALVTAAITVAVAISTAVASWYAPRVLEASERNHYFLMLGRPLTEIAALLAVSGAFVLVQRRHDPTRAVVFIGVGWCLAGLLLMRAAGVVAPIYSGIVLARALGTVPRDEPIYSVATYDQTLPFYSQRTVKLAAYRGELDFGLRHDPGAELPSVSDFVSEWQNVAAGFAVMEIPMFNELKGRGIPMREVARDLHRVAVARR
jgi:4-amino-4-deoxy-L-arabinose transferase-like glycosyltransferase